MSKLFKISFAVMTACLTIGSLSSFRNLDATKWYYNGSAFPQSEFNQIDNWSDEEVSEVSCGEDLDIPCQTNEEMTENQLEALLESNQGEDLFTHVSKREE